jgi:hypothetical protein
MLSPRNSKQGRLVRTKIALTLTSLFSIPVSLNAFSSELPKQVESKIINSSEELTEVIEVFSRRNQANTEVSVETQKLLKIAGLDHDPLSAVYSMPGVVYAGETMAENLLFGALHRMTMLFILMICRWDIFFIYSATVFLMKMLSVTFHCIQQRLAANMVMRQVVFLM